MTAQEKPQNRLTMLPYFGPYLDQCWSIGWVFGKLQKRRSACWKPDNLQMCSVLGQIILGTQIITPPASVDGILWNTEHCWSDVRVISYTSGCIIWTAVRARTAYIFWSRVWGHTPPRRKEQRKMKTSNVWFDCQEAAKVELMEIQSVPTALFSWTKIKAPEHNGLLKGFALNSSLPKESIEAHSSETHEQTRVVVNVCFLWLGCSFGAFGGPLD